MTQEEIYKQETGNAASFGKIAGYSKDFVEWLLKKADAHDLEKKRRVAAENLMSIASERELLLYHNNGCDCKFCDACEKYQSIVRQMEGK